jgi:serine/threonine protein phosphatase PrpC
MTIALRYTVRSDVGLLREGNEDAAYAGPYLLAIADGMGGHAAGEVASAVAISTLVPLDTDTSGVDMLQALSDAIATANVTLHEITVAHPATEGMGTTLTALLWRGDEVALCHVGDSRAYLLRDGILEQITHDHTLVQSLVDEGRLTPEAAASHPQRSLVMRALQSSIPAEPDLTMRKARTGDRYLLCSDGLTDVVSDETLRMTLSELTDLDAAVEQLIDLAIRSGGPDNITCVLADVVDTDTGAQASEQQILVGELVGDGGDSAEVIRSDNPAARAHLLAQGSQQPPAPDLPGQVSPAAAEPAGDDDDAAGEGEPDAADDCQVPAGRRRWPVVSCVLILLVGVISATGYYGWRLTQNQYYVGTVDGRVVVFRGVSEVVAGFSLSQVVQRTDIRLSALPSTEAGSIRSTIGPESSLRQAQRIITQFKQDYRCAVVQASIAKWVANRPKPARVVSKSKPSRARSSRARSSHHTRVSTTATSRTDSKPSSGHQYQAEATKPASNGADKTSAVKQASYPPEPVMPTYCPASTGVTG